MATSELDQRRASHPAWNEGEPNYKDLQMAELSPFLAFDMARIGYRPIHSGQLPTLEEYGLRDNAIIEGVKSIEELSPAAQRQGFLISGDQGLDLLLPTPGRSKTDYFDPKDYLYFARQDPKLEVSSYIRVGYRPSFDSTRWEKTWSLQVDRIVDLGDHWKNVTLDSAPSLVAPQSALDQAQDGSEATFVSMSDQRYSSSRYHRPALYIDGKLLTTNFVHVDREGEYPFSVDRKTTVIEAVSRSVALGAEINDLHLVSQLPTELLAQVVQDIQPDIERLHVQSEHIEGQELFPKVKEGKHYSKAQIAILDSIVRDLWVGGLGRQDITAALYDVPPFRINNSIYKLMQRGIIQALPSNLDVNESRMRFLRLVKEDSSTPIVEPSEKSEEKKQNEREFIWPVPEATQEFLRAAIVSGAFEKLDVRTRNLIGIYFGTRASLADLARLAQVSSVSKVIKNGLGVLWENLPLDLQKQFAEAELVKLPWVGKHPFRFAISEILKPTSNIDETPFRILTDKQYKSTDREVNRIKARIERSISHPITANGPKAVRRLKARLEKLEPALERYDNLRSGELVLPDLSQIMFLPQILIENRIAIGLTQGQLAERLGIITQQIQRYENSAYASASLQRILRVIDILQPDNKGRSIHEQNRETSRIITDDRQYNQTIREANLLRIRLGTRADNDTLQRQFEDLQRALQVYEDLRSGVRPPVDLSPFMDLGRMIIDNRIAKKLNHKQLAERLGLQAQQIQRYEQTMYASASLRRILEIAAALQQEEPDQEN